MTVAYSDQIVCCTFVEENSDPEIQKQYGSKRHYGNNGDSSCSCGDSDNPADPRRISTRTLDKLADMGQGFMFGVSPHHAVHYFSLVNLKGGLYSIVIGALIYVVTHPWMDDGEDEDRYSSLYESLAGTS